MTPGYATREKGYRRADEHFTVRYEQAIRDTFLHRHDLFDGRAKTDPRLEAMANRLYAEKLNELNTLVQDQPTKRSSSSSSPPAETKRPRVNLPTWLSRRLTLPSIQRVAEKNLIAPREPTIADIHLATGFMADVVNAANAITSDARGTRLPPHVLYPWINKLKAEIIRKHFEKFPEHQKDTDFKQDYEAIRVITPYDWSDPELILDEKTGTYSFLSPSHFTSLEFLQNGIHKGTYLRLCFWNKTTEIFNQAVYESQTNAIYLCPSLLASAILAPDRETGLLQLAFILGHEFGHFFDVIKYHPVIAARIKNHQKMGQVDPFYGREIFPTPTQPLQAIDSFIHESIADLYGSYGLQWQLDRSNIPAQYRVKAVGESFRTQCAALFNSDGIHTNPVYRINENLFANPALASAIGCKR